ncbi:hypothetical protein JCM13664_19020 [Methylothermus subterraneus]
MIACYALGVQLAASALLAWLGPDWLWRATLGAEAGFLTGLVFYLRRLDPYILGLKAVDWGEAVLVVLWLQAIAFASDAAILWLAPAALLDRYLQLFQPHSPAEWFALAALAVGVAPVIEEVLFRGLLLAALRYRLGTAAAIVASALLFSAIHLEWVQIAAALPVGLMLGAYVARGGSLYVTAAAHILGNGFSFLGLICPGLPWLSADWRPTDSEGALALLVAAGLLGKFLRRYPIA